MAKLYVSGLTPNETATVPGIVDVNDVQFAPHVSSLVGRWREIIDQWEGVAVVIEHHPPTDSWIFIAIHDLTLGPAAGGTRVRVYETPDDALRDAFRLSSAMTSKWAMIESEWGGGKGVLSLNRELNSNERHNLLSAYANLVNTLNGSFVTAGDLGTTQSDLVYLSGLSQHVTAGDQSHGESVDSGMYTALGLRAAIRACCRELFSDDHIRDRSVLVQGLGQVGGMLARLLVLDGARVFVNDLDEKRAKQFQDELGCDLVDSAAVYETACDVYAPCGTGGTLNDETMARFRCRAICGGANNQLSVLEIADKLHQRGILYAPDYVVNAGGAIGLTMFGRGEPETEIYARIEEIESTLLEIFEKAHELRCSPLQVADAKVKEFLTAAHDKGPAHQILRLLSCCITAASK